MNRAERRRAAREAGRPAPVYDRTMATVNREYDRVLNDIRTKSTEDALVLCFTVPIMVLRKYYGWGSRKRLPDFAEKLTDEYQRVFDSGMNLRTYADECEKLTGIKFQMTDDEPEDGKLFHKHGGGHGV